uniref:Protein kinase domain-containing protein n=1 Tax=Cryptomonas curvata TaxID=233186 RepID=A0A7S0M5X2_9CRYP|mmetsp:Transcript_24767/g.51778  ORF Transcript_24767/g.51778 Transcript_24767/m.51778 type:complete len:469 (+) Transcript_24767:90-1496(+)
MNHGRGFKIQKALPEKHGSLKKKRKLLGGLVVRYFKVGWDGDHAVLYYSNDESMSSGTKKLSLQRCFARSSPSNDQTDKSLFCFELEFLSSPGSKKCFYAPSDLERNEWAQIIRKYSVNSSIDNVYTIGTDKDSKLGSGSFSTVYKGVERDTRKVWAIKTMLKSNIKREEEDNLKDEIRISLLVGSHPHIVYMKEFIENADKYYIVLEFLTGGELFDRIVDSPGGHFTEKDAANIMGQLMSALGYLHGKSIAHRDLKPENFLMATAEADAVVKIADFGFACNVTHPTSLNGLCGSPGYVAPEIMKEKDGYGLAVDIWSMGVILYILLTGIPPFAADNDEESFILTLRGNYDKKPLEDISPSGRDLVSRMLTYNPAKRISAEHARSHAWLLHDAPAKALKVQDNMRSWRARMRFKKAIIATVATQRMHAIMRKVAGKPVDRRPSVEDAAADLPPTPASPSASGRGGAKG